MSGDGFDFTGESLQVHNIHTHRYPENVRPRISQALVLPPFQRAGHGAALLRAAYDYCIRTHPSDKLVDIAVEDPSENFTQLRDKVDTENCWKAFPKACTEGASRG